MQTLNQLIQSAAELHKRVALMEHLTRHALAEGVAYRKSVEEFMQEQKDYQPALLFPIASQTNSLGWQREVLASLTEVKSIVQLAKSYRLSLYAVAQAIHSYVCAMTQQWSAIQVAHQNLTSAARTTGQSNKTQSTRQLSVSTMLSLEDEPSLHSLKVTSCHRTINGQVVLPIASRTDREVTNTSLRGLGGRMPCIQHGPVFEVWLGDSMESLEPIFEVSLQRESLVNSITIPWMLPLPDTIQSIVLMDRSRRMTKSIPRSEIEPLLQSFPGSLELYFPPVSCAFIRIACQKEAFVRMPGHRRVDMKDSTIRSLSSFNEILRDIYQSYAVEQSRLQETLHDLMANLNQVTDDSVSTEVATLGLSLRASLVQYEKRGAMLWGAYRGPNAKSCVLQARGKLPQTNGSWMPLSDMTDATKLPCGSIEWHLSKRDRDKERNVIRVIRAGAVPARPFLNRVVGILHREDGIPGRNQMIYTLPHYVEPSEAISFYVASNEGLLPVGVRRVNDDNNLITRVISDTPSHMDLVVRYDIDAAAGVGKLSDARQSYFTNSGGVRFADAAEPVVESDIQVRALLKRAAYNPYLTPVLSEGQLTVFHEASQ